MSVVWGCWIWIVLIRSYFVRDDTLNGDQTSLDIATSKNLKTLVVVERRLKMRMSRVNLETSQFEEVEGEGTNEEALIRLTKQLSDERKLRELGTQNRFSRNMNTKPQEMEYQKLILARHATAKTEKVSTKLQELGILANTMVNLLAIIKQNPVAILYVVGDFNSIRTTSERVGRNVQSCIRYIAQFDTFIRSNGLVDLPNILGTDRMDHAKAD
ncbi:hypothetical protein OROHE_012924 [Orobanche hederae]